MEREGGGEGKEGETGPGVRHVALPGQWCSAAHGRRGEREGVGLGEGRRVGWGQGRGEREAGRS